MSFYQIERSLSNNFAQAVNNPELLTRHADNLDDIKAAVYDVYGSKSIIARRMKGRQFLNDDIGVLLDNVGQRIFEYFNSSVSSKVLAESHDTFIKKIAKRQKDYDDFFISLCRDFMAAYNSLAESYNRMNGANAIKIIEFGIAQKLINMVFKYVSCYEDYSGFCRLFIFCHMPIDSYVLHYFGLFIPSIPNIQSSFSANSVSPLAKYYGATWSNIVEEQYLNLVRQYRSFFSTQFPDFTMLNLEYYLWDTIKRRDFTPIAPQGSEYIL